MAGSPIVYPTAPPPAPSAPAAPVQVPVFSPKGEFGYLPAEQWDLGAELQGYRLASPEEVRKAQLEKQYGGPGSSIVAGGFAGLRALTFGASDWVGEKFGEAIGMTPEQSQAGLRELAEAHPTATTVGTIAGVGVPLLLTAGADAPLAEAQAATAGAKAATGAARLAELAPPSLVAKLGKTVAKGIEGALPEAESLAGKIATKALAVGAGSAIEGAAYGAGQVVSEAALGDPNLTAQSALATIGLSSALGGGIGGLFGAAEVAIPAAVRGASDAVSGAVGKFRQAYPEIYERLTGVEGSAEQVREAIGKYQAAVKDPRQILQLQRDLGGSIEDVANRVAEAQKRLYTEARPAEIAEQIRAQSAWDLKPLTAAQSALDSLRGAAKTIRADPDLYEQGFAAKLEQIANGLERRIADGDAVQAFEELRTARQQVDQFAKYTDRGLSALPFKEREAVQLVRGVRGVIRDALHDESAWGPTAVRQAALDEAHSEYAQALKTLTGGKLSPLNSNLLRKVVQGSGEELQLNPRALRTFLAQMGDSRSEQIVEALGNYLRKADDYTRAMEDSFRHAPTANFDRQGIADLIEKTGALSEKAKLQAEATRALNDLNPHAQFSGSGVKALLPGGISTTEAGLGTLAAAPLVGHLVPGAGPLAAAYGAFKAVAGLKNVPQTVATLANLERMAQKIAHAIDAGAGMIVRGGGGKAAAVGRAETLAGVSREFGASSEAAQRTFAKRVAEVQGYSQNPESLHRAIASQNEGLEQHAPDTSQAMAITTARAVSFLASKVPQAPLRGPLAHEWTPSRSQISKFARYYEAVQDPMVVLKQAAAGTLTREAIEAVQAVYPELYARMRQGIVDRLASRGVSVPARSRIALSMVLGQDLDGRISMLIANQRAHQAPTQKKADTLQPAPSAGKLTVSNRMLTPQQASLDRRG